MSNQNRSPQRRGIAVRSDKAGREQFRGSAYDRRARRHLFGPWTSNLAEARAWRVDALSGLQAGTLSADRGVTVREAAKQFVAGIECGAIRNRSGGVYKPSAVRGLKRDLNNRVVVAFGASYPGRSSAARRSAVGGFARRCGPRGEYTAERRQRASLALGLGAPARHGDR